MNTRLGLLSASLLLVTSVVFAADPPKLPEVPADPIAKKKELLFSDDLERAELGNGWTQVVPTFTMEDGALKGTQTRIDTPAAEGKPAIVGHQAVVGNDIPTKDSVIELKFKFAGNLHISVEFDDRKFTGSHYGHICYARMTPKTITLMDQRDGTMNNEIMAMAKDPAMKAERAKRMAGRTVIFPVEIEVGTWHHLVLETVEDTMRASIDGKAVAFLKSSGIGHPTKSKIELGCWGQSGFFDEIKIWNAEPAK